MTVSVCAFVLFSRSKASESAGSPVSLIAKVTVPQRQPKADSYYCDEGVSGEGTRNNKN